MKKKTVEAQLFAGSKIPNMFIKAFTKASNKMIGDSLGATIIYDEDESSLDEAFEGFVATMTEDMSCAFIYLDDNHFWFNKRVNYISNDGEDWRELVDYINFICPTLDIKTNEYKFITSIKVKELITG